MDEPGHLPVDTSTAAPAKSILKKASRHVCEDHSSDCSSESHDASRHRAQQWDEMNILATFHPPGKDYGHMKIDDPPTPYHEYTQEMIGEDDKMDATDASNPHLSLRERKASFSDTTPEVLDADTIAEKLSHQHKKPAKTMSSDSEDDSNLTDEERAKKKEFQSKRKQHYNEFQAVKLARQLLEDEEDEDENDKD